MGAPVQPPYTPPPLLEAAVARSDYQVASSIVLPKDPSHETGCVISRIDYHILIEGSGSGRKARTRDSALGAGVAGISSLAGVVATVPEGVSLQGGALLVTIGMAIVGFAGLVVAALFHLEIRNDSNRPSFRECSDRIRRSLGLAEKKQP